MKHKPLLALAFLLAVLVVYLAMCRLVLPPAEVAPTPTFPGSATPVSEATATPTASATASSIPPATPSDSPPSGTETAVVTPPTDTATAVSTPTMTQTSTPTPNPPTVTPAARSLVIVPGLTYWDTAGTEYGRFECWQNLKAVNGWEERRLPIGELMTIPRECR